MQKEPISLFDESKFKQRLRDTQMPNAQVDAHVENLHELVLILADEEEYANQKIDGMIKKLDDALYEIRQIRLEIKEDMASLRVEMANLRAEMKEDMAKFGFKLLVTVTGWMLVLFLGQLGILILNIKY